MNTDSFSDEQLLNLVNNTIETKTEFSRNDFTGGSVIVTTTHNNSIKKFKVSLYFGYNGKHPVNRQIEISKDSYYIWAKAILIKVFSLDMNNVGMDLNELNLLMNSNSISNTSNSIEYSGTTVPTTVPTQVPKKKEFTFKLSKATQYDNLSKEYKLELCTYAINSGDKNYNLLNAMIDHHSSKGNTFKDWSAAFRTWKRNDEKFNGSKDVVDDGKPKVVFY